MPRFNIPFIVLMVVLLTALVVACSSEPDSNGDQEPQTEPSAGVVNSASQPLVNRLVKLVDPLDDPDHYCIDVPGFGENVRVESALQAHTCKPTDNVDEQFTFLETSGQLRMDQYQRCVEAASVTEGAQLFITECSDNLLQRFDVESDGTIRLPDDTGAYYCIGVGDAPGIRINAIHIRRVLELRECASTNLNLMTWAFVTEASQPE